MAVKDRVAACLAALQAEKLDTLVGFTGDIHNFLLCEPVFTLTGFKTIDSCAVVLGADGRPTLIVTPAWDAGRAAERCPGMRVVPTDDLAAAVAAELKTRPGRIGVAGLDLLPMHVAAKARAVVGPDAKKVDQMVRWIGRKKTADEIDNARRATVIAEKGYDELLRIVRPGMREYELSAELYCFMKSLGSEDNFFLMSSAAHNLAVRAPRSRVIAEGDIVLVEITPCVEGQFSQVCRTVSIGEPSAEVKAKFKLLQEATDIGFAAARPGATVAEAATAMDDVFRKAGYGDYCRPPYMRVRGHGLGALSDLPGDIATDNPTVLETDMVFILHPNQYFPETGYLMCGEPVRIGGNRAEPLTVKRAELDSVTV